MNAVANAETRPQAWVAPEVDVYETKDGYVIEAELPGVSKDGLEITLEDNELTIVGRRQRDDVKAELVYRETSSRDYRRVFALDPSVDTSKIDARVEQGVLTVRLPRAEAAKPRKIEVGN